MSVCDANIDSFSDRQTFKLDQYRIDSYEPTPWEDINYKTLFSFPSSSPATIFTCLPLIHKVSPGRTLIIQHGKHFILYSTMTLSLRLMNRAVETISKHTYLRWR